MGQDYSSYLRTIGIDEASLAVDSRGTIVTARRARIDGLPSLPIMSIAEVGRAPADIEILDVLGTGGMGEVLLGRQHALKREVAVKRLHGADRELAAAHLLREAMVTGRLEHPHIVPVHMLAVAEDGSPFFVMKRIEGTRWKELLRDPSAGARGVTGARALLAQLERPNAELAERVAKLESKEGARVARIAALEKLERDIDINFAAKSRSTFVSLIGIVVLAGTFAVGWLTRRGELEVRHVHVFTACLLFAAINIIVVDGWLKHSFNDAGLRTRDANAVSSLSMSACWWMTWRLGIPFAESSVIFVFMIALNWIVAGTMFDRRLRRPAVTYGIATVLIAIFRDYQWEIFGVATAVGFFLLSSAWKRRAA